MGSPNDLWQSRAVHWQPAFIRENLLSLGHAAWQGYEHHGRGLVVCAVTIADTASVNWHEDAIQHRLRYIPAVAVPDYLKSHDLPSDVGDRLLDMTQTYRPEHEVLVAIEQNGEIEISWLRNMAIAPPDCYHQVCQRWEEFNLKP